MRKLFRSHEFKALLLISCVHVAYFQSLFRAQSTLSHDNLLWNFPLFARYFSELISGHWPLYNFWSRMGEPLIPALAQMRLFDPVLTIWGLLISSVTADKIQAFNIFRYGIGFVQCLGVYLCFRQEVSSTLGRAFLFTSILFSSIFLAPMRQDGILNQFLWIPFLTVFIRQFFLDSKPQAYHFWGLALLLGSSFQSYFFVFTVVYLALYISLQAGVGKRFIFSAKNLLFLLVPLLCMGALNLSTYWQSREWIFPARTPPVSMDQDHLFTPRRLELAEHNKTSLMAEGIGSGASASPWEFIQVFDPTANLIFARYPDHHFGRPSESFYLFSLCTLLAGLCGLAQMQKREAWVWANLLAVFFLLSLSRDLPFFKEIAHAVPPLKLVRNTHCLAPFVQFSFFYFVAIGANFILQTRWFNHDKPGV